jgi:hypothetical protein
MKIESFMGYEEGFLSLLQTYHDIKQYKDKKFSRLPPPKTSSHSQDSFLGYGC